MTTNEPIDPDELELDDMLLDLAAQGGDPTMFEAIATHDKTGKVIEKHAKFINKARPKK